MKKSILAISVTLILFSCKKDETPAEFTATDVNGTSQVKGYIVRPVIIKDSTSIKFADYGAAGIPVTITVKKSELYPNSNAQGADVYRGTSDANGFYAINVRSNSDGVAAMLSIDGFQGTKDTIKNGATIPGNSMTFVGTSTTLVLYMGHNVTFNHDLEP